MEFEDLLKYKPHIPFNVIEKDLDQDPKLRIKTYFDETDARIDHSNKRLEKGEVEIPVFKDQTIRPLGFKGKLLDYELEPKGAGFYIITHKRGKIKPKPNDRQHPNEEIDRRNGGLVIFYITYDRTNKSYKYIDSEKTFLSQYEEIEALKNSPDVQRLINDFTDWIQTFWSSKYKSQHHFGNVTSDQTYQDYLDIIEDLKKNLPMIKSYHLLLNIFGDICDQTYEYIKESLKQLERFVLSAEEHIHPHFPSPKIPVDHHSDKLHGRPLLDLIQFMQERILTRGYFIDKKARKPYRNVAEVFYGEQFSQTFESDKSKKERVQELMEKALDGGNEFFHYTFK